MLRCGRIIISKAHLAFKPKTAQRWCHVGRSPILLTTAKQAAQRSNVFGQSVSSLERNNRIFTRCLSMNGSSGKEIFDAVHKKIDGCTTMSDVIKVLRVINDPRTIPLDETVPLVEALVWKLRKEKISCSINEASQIMFNISRLSSHKKCIRDVLLYCADQLEKNQAEILTTVELRQFMRGLRYCAVEHDEVLTFIKRLNNLISSNESSVSGVGGDWMASDIQMLYGIQSMIIGMDTPPCVVQLVDTLSSYLLKAIPNTDPAFVSRATQLACQLDGDVEEPTSVFDEAKHMLNHVPIAVGMYGLQNVKLANHEYGVANPAAPRVVETILNVVIRYLTHATDIIKNQQSLTIDPISTQAVGMMFFGMRGLSSDYGIVRNLLRSVNDYYRTLHDSLGAEAFSGLFSIRDLGKVFYGLQGMHSRHIEVRELMGTLTPVVSRLRPEDKSNVSPYIYYGFQNMSGSYPVTKDWLDIMNKYVSNYSGTIWMDQIAEALYGLRKLTTGSEDKDCVAEPYNSSVRNALSTICNIITKNARNSTWTKSADVSYLMFGFQYMSTDCEEVRSLIKAVTPLIATLDIKTKPFTTAHISSICYCFNRMSGKCGEVEGLLQTFTKLFNTQLHYISTYDHTDEVGKYQLKPFSPQQLGMCLYGFQNISGGALSTPTSNQSSGTMDLTLQLLKNIINPLVDIGAIIRETSHSTALLPIISLAFTGLQRMSPTDNIEVRKLLKSLSLMISSVGGTDSNHGKTRPLNNSHHACVELEHIARIVNGLQSMPSEDSGPELLTLLATLGDKIDQWYVAPKYDFNTSFGFVARCMYGFQNMSADQMEVRFLLSVITKRVLKPLGAPNRVEKATFQHVPLQDLSDILYGLRLMSSQHLEVREFVEVLSDVIKNRCIVMAVSDTAPSAENSKSHYVSKSFAKVTNSDTVSKVTDALNSNIRINEIIASNVNTDVPTWSPYEASRALYGLNRMRSNSKAVCQLLSIINPYYSKEHIRVPQVDLNTLRDEIEPKKSLDEVSVANLLYGCRNLGTQHDESRLLIANLAGLIAQTTSAGRNREKYNKEGCNTEIEFTSPRNIAMCIYGLRRSSSRSTEVRYLLNVLNTRFKTYDRQKDAVPFQGDDVAMLINGLQWMDSNSSEVRSLLRLINPWIKACATISETNRKSFYTLSHVKMIIDGLLNMHSKHREVVELLEILCHQIIISIPNVVGANLDDEELETLISIKQSLQTLVLKKNSVISPDLSSVKALLRHFQINPKNKRYSDNDRKSAGFGGEKITSSVVKKWHRG